MRRKAVKSASKLFFESAQRNFRRRLEEDEILPPLEDAVGVVDDTEEEEEPVEQAVAERRSRLRRSRRSRLRRRLRARLEGEGNEDEFVEVNEPVFLEDEDAQDEFVGVEDPEEVVTSPAVAARRARLRRARLRRSRLRKRISTGRRFRDGFDTEQLGENIRNSVDYTVIKERLAKVKNRRGSSTKFRSGSVVTRGNKLGKFSMRMRNGRTVTGTVKYRLNGTVKSFKVSR